MLSFAEKQKEEKKMAWWKHEYLAAICENENNGNKNVDKNGDKIESKNGNKYENLNNNNNDRKNSKNIGSKNGSFDDIENTEMTHTDYTVNIRSPLLEQVKKRILDFLRSVFGFLSAIFCFFLIIFCF